MKSASRKLTYVCLFVFTCFSCVDKEDASPQETITFTVIDSYQKYWIVLSDASGKVLTWKALTNGVAETFTYASTEEGVMLTTIAKSPDMNNTNIKSYAAVKAGDYKIDFTYSVPSAGTEGTYLINIDNPSQFNIITPQSEGSCGFSDLYSNPARMNLNLCDESNNLLITVVGYPYGDTPRYLYNEDIAKKGSMTIDKNLFDQLPVMNTKTVNFNKPFLSGYSFMEGRTIKKKQTFYLPAYFNPDNNRTQIKIYYPDLIGTLFSSYTTTIDLTWEDNVRHIISKEATEPPTSYQELDVNWNFADSVKISTQSISAHASGQADYIFTAFNYYDATHTVWWSVHSPFVNDFSIHPPQFPEDLKASAKLELVDKVVRTQINFIEDKGLGGYEGFYKAELNQTTAPRNLPYDRRSKVYRINHSPYIPISGRVASTHPYLDVLTGWH